MSGFLAVFLAALFILTGQPRPSTVAGEIADGSSAQFAEDHKDRTQQQIPLPISDLPSKESETAEENEVKDGADDELDAAFNISRLDQQAVLVSGTGPLSQVSPSHQTRSTVSLVILHHCWKTFLS